MALGISAYVYWREDYIRPVFRKRCTLQDYDAIVEVASPIVAKNFVLKLLWKYLPLYLDTLSLNIFLKCVTVCEVSGKAR